MAKIRLTVMVDCADERVASYVQNECFSNLNDLLAMEGVFGVHAEWLAERQDVPDAQHPERQDPNYSAP